MKKKILFLALAISQVMVSLAQTAMHNIYSRERVSLNGEWDILPDPFKGSDWSQIKDPSKNSLAEVQYEGWQKLKVPGDWNHQRDEYIYYEGNIWYKKSIDYTPQEGKRAFIHFGAVSMHCDVFLNGENLGSHKGAFSPFQFEVTDKLKSGQNDLIVRVDNCRSETTIPALMFDWWNYGGITRDVDLVYVPETYIYDYTVGLADNNPNMLSVKVKLNGAGAANQRVTISIPEEGITLDMTTNSEGEASHTKRCKLDLWSTDNPKLYDVVVNSSSDKVDDKIGFRTIEVKGEDILLNGKPIFLRGINIHEEIAAEQRRSYSQADAEFLVQQAVDLGCNYIRLSHYAHNEYMVKEAERRGILMWEEIPTWQRIKFSDEGVRQTARTMMMEMIERDKNRCGIILWSISNETRGHNKGRTEFLVELADEVREKDPTRLVTSALDGSKFAKDEESGLFYMYNDDPLIDHLDVVGINQYNGWYAMYPCDPAKLEWRIGEGKPVVMTEFGSECVYGNDEGDTSNLNSWSETYMEQNYRNNVASFANFSNLRGTSPWILFDFRSPRRPHALFQMGWNRKGLTSPSGGRKRAWYVMQEYYQQKADEWE
ncbi:MAG: glycoside hydrolase family 2 TIM barrel-domain containing protein [Rikenellaceae bacterium]